VPSNKLEDIFLNDQSNGLDVGRTIILQQRMTNLKLCPHSHQ